MACRPAPLTVRLPSGRRVDAALADAGSVAEVRRRVSAALACGRSQRVRLVVGQRVVEDGASLDDLASAGGEVTVVLDELPPRVSKGVAEASRKLSFPSHLVPARRMGSGSFGEVFLCDDHDADRQVAVRQVRNFATDRSCGVRVLREIRVLAAMQHENLVGLLDVLLASGTNEDDVYIVMPHMNVDLHRVIQSKMALSQAHTNALMCQILRGLRYLHLAHVVHWDLRPSKILMNKDCTLRISGFGREHSDEGQRFMDHGQSRTMWYAAPELMLIPLPGCTAAVDLWSAGCIHAELLTRKPLFPGKHCLDMLRQVVALLGLNAERDLHWIPSGSQRSAAQAMLASACLPPRPAEELETRFPSASAECLDLLRSLLTVDPRARMTAADALQHAMLAHLREASEPVVPDAYDSNSGEERASPRSLKDRVRAERSRLHPEEGSPKVPRKVRKVSGC